MSRHSVIGPRFGAAAAASVVPLLAFLGCMTVKYPRTGDVLAPGADEALVFGRVRVIDCGAEITPWNDEFWEMLSPYQEPAILLSVFHVERGKRGILPRLEPDGRFSWIIPRGTYLLYHTRPESPVPNEPLAAFQVPPGPAAVYLGVLTMQIESEPDSETGEPRYSLAAVEVADEFPIARDLLLARYRVAGEDIARSPMVCDPALRTLFEDYSRRRCEEILNAHGIRLLEKTGGAR